MMRFKSKHAGYVAIETMEQRVFFDASMLTETISTSTLSATISDQSVLKGKVSVVIDNNTDAVQKQKLYISLLITSSPSLDLLGQDFSVLTSKSLGTVSIKPGVPKTVNLSVSTKTSTLGDGTFTVYSALEDSVGATSQTSTGPVVTIAPPFIQLAETESFVKLPASIVANSKFNVTDKIVISNTGTDEANGTATIGVYATTDGTIADGTLIDSISKSVKIKPGKPFPYSFKLPTFPDVAAGNYELITQVSDPNGAVTTTNPAAAPVIAVQTAAPAGSIDLGVTVTQAKPLLAYSFEDEGDYLYSLTVSATVKNIGSVRSSGNTTFAVYYSGSPTFDETAGLAATPVTENATLPVHGSHPYKFVFKTGLPNFANASNTPYSFYLFMVVTDPTGATHVGSYGKLVEFGD